MDYSFCTFLEPRKSPEPTSFLKNTLDSLVPDVSIIEKFDPKASYNSWKSENIVVPVQSFDKENNKNVNNIKKQVSFSDRSQNNSSDDEFHFKNRKFNKNVSSINKATLPTPSVSTLINRELELSLIDHRRSNHISPILSNRQVPCSPQEYIQKPNSYHEWLRMKEQEKKLAELKNKKSEPTVNDLYKMVQDQNDSLKNLQKQVETLLQQNSQLQTAKNNDTVINKAWTPEIICSCQCNKPVSTKNVETNTSLNPVQVSIGVMTSFQISLNPENIETPITNNVVTENLIKDTPLTTRDCNNHQIERNFLEADRFQSRFPNKPFNLGGYNSNLTNTTEGIGSRFREYSLSEIPEIPEPLEDQSMSASGSIHVDLQEFQESSDEEETEDSNEAGLQENNIGWTVYNNVVGQVQNILETSPKENEDNSNKNDPNIIMIENIKMSALNQLQELGISISDINIPMLLDPEFLYKNQRGSPNDMSVEVNQLVMKYLRDDQLSFLVTKNQMLQTSPSRRQCKNSPANEMSFSTIKYMQKYRLWGQINKSPEQFAACNVQKVMTNREFPQNQRYVSKNKILDITALKQQPKLL